MSRHNNREAVYKVRFRNEGMVKTATVVALNYEQAERMARSFLKVISVAKARRDYDRIVAKEFADFTTELIKDIAQPKLTPLAMDEFIWLRRNQRRENIPKDKNKKD